MRFNASFICVFSLISMKCGLSVGGIGVMLFADHYYEMNEDESTSQTENYKYDQRMKLRIIVDTLMMFQYVIQFLQLGSHWVTTQS